MVSVGLTMEASRMKMPRTGPRPIQEITGTIASCYGMVTSLGKHIGTKTAPKPIIFFADYQVSTFFVFGIFICEFVDIFTFFLRTRCAAGCLPGYKRNGDTCEKCSGGHFAATISSETSCEECPPGRYGNEEGLESPQCSGECEEGYYCPSGSTSPRERRW